MKLLITDTQHPNIPKNLLRKIGKKYHQYGNICQDKISIQYSHKLMAAHIETGDMTSPQQYQGKLLNHLGLAR